MDLPCKNCSVLYSSKGNSNHSSHSNRQRLLKTLVSTLPAYLVEISRLLSSQCNPPTLTVPLHQTRSYKEILRLRRSLEESALASLSSNLHSRANRSTISWHSSR